MPSDHVSQLILLDVLGGRVADTRNSNIDRKSPYMSQLLAYYSSSAQKSAEIDAAVRHWIKLFNRRLEEAGISNGRG
jgi:hypothetical protein